MALTGRCYCGAVRYESRGEPGFKALCLCRECQYISGGAGNLFMIVPGEGFAYVEGEPKRYARADLAQPYTREFCPQCGTHLVTRSPTDASMVVLKVGTLDDPAAYGGPQAVIWTSDAQPFHVTPPGAPQFASLPGR